MKQKIFFLSFVLLIILISESWLAGGPRKLIYLDAAILPEGQLRSWRNLGTLGGDFSPVFRSRPSVENIKGQKAVNLSGVDLLLRSNFVPTSALNGRQPFTIIAKIYVPELAQRQIILNWSQEPGKSAIFGVGKRLEAAFYNSDQYKLGFSGGYPEPKQWHLIALTYDRQASRLYVDGWLKAEIQGPLNIKPGSVFYLGGQTVTGFPLPFDPLNGCIASLEVIDTAYSPVEIWNASGHHEAIPVYPADGQLLETLNVSLKWEKGDERATSFSVYFSSSREEVEKGQAKAKKGNLAGDQNNFEISNLEPGKTYFWRVDEIDSNGKIWQPGIIRSFKIDDGSAKNPIPHNLHGSVSLDLKRLSWTPGPWAVTQDVYLANNPEKVIKGRPLVQGLKPEQSYFFISPKNLKSGETYYWRVKTKNGQLPESPGEVWSFRIQDPVNDDDLTFFVVSDLHYGGTMNARKINRQMVEAMNALPGEPYPKEFGIKGKVHTPKGVVILGDIVDDGASTEVEKFWQEYVEDYGFKGDRLLAFPVYEGFGESDGPSNGLVRTNLKNRNRLRTGLKSLSSDGLHYSWDWGKVHFIQLNLYPGSVGEEYLNYWGRRLSGDARYPKHSLEFLIEDLRKNVGGSGQPVVIFQHYGFDSWGETWWTEKERQAFFQAIQPYNVIAIFWGHSHIAQGFSWNGIKTWCDGTPNKDPDTGDFLVVNIKTGRRSGQMIVATRKVNSWEAAEKISFPMKKVQK
ncbi:MAG: LamG-like jellyroll fold domain-containing protein [Candidatus Saccharicenans sp.]